MPRLASPFAKSCMMLTILDRVREWRIARSLIASISAVSAISHPGGMLISKLKALAILKKNASRVSTCKLFKLRTRDRKISLNCSREISGISNSSAMLRAFSSLSAALAKRKTMRSRISPAALRVNVVAKMDFGCTPLRRSLI